MKKNKKTLKEKFLERLAEWQGLNRNEYTTTTLVSVFLLLSGIMLLIGINCY